ncbi:hypothetical protein JVX91_00495 [Pseudomonas sp. PDNC002]|uniref:hypothetical protein n=1 Tax=Pseudomonas sp. PDNC002 TaxID=2811422 RepID=UPI001965ACE8|nr:hypothetical protein [Pseudomonas sp. PDNC002]QRY79626.1 hypothetical protein JVX91_00495 [Pseudomonas sp. PDNC002]
MAKVLQHKVVSALPSPLEANSIYFVRVGTGFDIYVTNSSGTIVAYPINREPLIEAGTSAQFWRGDKAWTDFASTVRSSTLAGLSSVTTTAILATDTVLQGMGKAQGQINTINTALSGKASAGVNTDISSLNGITGAITMAAGARILGDYSNSTIANRVAFQNSIANNPTSLSITPNGTSNGANINAFFSSDMNNSYYCGYGVDGIASNTVGTGAQRMFTFVFNGVERGRVDTSGNWLFSGTNIDPVGAGVPGCKIAGQGQLNVFTASGTVANVGTKVTSGALLAFYYNPAGTLSGVGSITTNGTQTAYNVSSDGRLKDKVVDADAGAAWDRLDGYRIRSFVFKAAPDKVVPFGGIAGELQENNPDMVTGEVGGVEELGTLYERRPVGSLYDEDHDLVAAGIEEPDEYAGDWIFTGTAEFVVAVDIPTPTDELPGARWEKTSERMIIQGVDWSKAVPELILNQQTAKAKIIALEVRAAEQDARIADLETRLQQLLNRLSA